MAYTKHFEDSFTEASDTALTSHTPDMGVGWSFVDGPSDNAEVYAADDTAIFPWISSFDFAFYAADISGGWAAAQKAESQLPGSKTRIAVRVDLTVSVGRCYEGFYNSGASSLTVNRRDSPTSSTNLISDPGISAGGTDILTLTIDGDQIEIALNGTPSPSSPVTDATYADGSPGAVFQKAVESGGLDNFAAYDQAAGGTTLSPASSGHGHSAETGGFAQTHVLDPASVAQNHSAVATLLVQYHSVEVNGSDHAHGAAGVVLSSGTQVAANSAAHQQTSTTAFFGQAHDLTPMSAAFAHLVAVAIFFTQSEIIVSPGFHAIGSTGVTFGTGVLAPDERMIRPEAPARLVRAVSDTRMIRGER
jgi:hypothetical protein